MRVLRRMIDTLLYDRKEKVAKILIEFFNVRVTQ
jgi:hypothetical protein